MPDVVELQGAIDLFAGIAVSQRDDLAERAWGVRRLVTLIWHGFAECIVAYAHIYRF